MNHADLETPIGRLRVSANDDGAVVAVAFVEEENLSVAASGPAAEAARQLREYFDGSRRSFDLELAPDGTEFEQTVWSHLTSIPFGSTDTYGTIAHRLGDPGASRAVGVANARNPIAVIIPCHRVIGSDGDLTGYAGGLWRKKWLLAHESGQTSLGF